MESKHHVHHSYIWLGSLRAFAYCLWAIVIGSASSIFAMFEDGISPDVNLVGDIYLGFGIVVVLGIIALATVFLIVFCIHWVSYKHLYYVLTPDEFNLYKGIFVKSRVHVPYDRVQSVDLRASLLQRVFGVRTVFIDTAGGAQNKAVTVPYVALSAAEALQHELYARKNAETAETSETTPSLLHPNLQNNPVPVAGFPSSGCFQSQKTSETTPSPQRGGNVLDAGVDAWRQAGGIFAGKLGDTQDSAFTVKLTNKELIYAALSNSGGFVLMLVAFFAFGMQFFGFLFDYSGEQINDMALANALGIFNDSNAVIIFAIAAVVMLLFLLALFAIFVITQCLNYGGFQTRRRKDRIEVEYGLLSHTAKSVSISRVQAVVIKQSFIRRLIGYCELSLDKVDAASAGDKSQEKELNPTGIVIHPFCKLSDASFIIQNVVPEFADAPNDINSVAPQAKRRAILRRCIWQGVGFWLFAVTFIAQIIYISATSIEFADTPLNLDVFEMMASNPMFGFIDIIFGSLYIISAIAFILALISAIIWAKDSGASFNERFLTITNGGLTSVTRTIPRNKIQYGETLTNPFQRIARVVTLKARTAAGIGGTSVKIWDMPVEVGDAWLKWVEPRKL